MTSSNPGNHARNPDLYHSSISITGRFGSRLRQFRKDRNMTQREMADRFGMDRTFISDLERGRKSISLFTLEVIALGMKVSLSELMEGM